VEHSTVKTIREESRARVRDAVVHAAMQILLEQGQEALSLRKVAAAVGASTQVIATHFADKQGLLDALFARGFAGLTEQTRALPPDAGVAGCMRAYRAFALGRPSLYRLMFTRTEPDYRPGREAKDAAAAALEALVDAIGAPAGTGTASAHFVWAVAHGHVALELADLVHQPPTAESLYEFAIAHVEDALRG
jgi:AcrR family transcriptional regulator